MDTSVFATSNYTRKLSGPLQSRFFVAELEPYSYDQFYEITLSLLHNQSKVAPLFLGATLPLILFLFPNHVVALSEQERYDIGWQSGISQAQYDWNNNLPYDPLCPAHHSDSFCMGFQASCNHWWDSAQRLSNQQVTEQNAKVEIRGNGNHVTISQQSNGKSSDDGWSVNPRCSILCANVQIW
jgi:hypothetical protein